MDKEAVEKSPAAQSLSGLVKAELEFMDQGSFSYLYAVTVGSLVSGVSKRIQGRDNSDSDTRSRRLQSISQLTGLGELQVEAILASTLTHVGPCQTTADRDAVKLKLTSGAGGQTPKPPNTNHPTQSAPSIPANTLTSLAVQLAWNMVNTRRQAWLAQGQQELVTDESIGGFFRQLPQRASIIFQRNG